MMTTEGRQQTTKLTEEEVKHVAKLANLSLKDAEIEKFQKQLSAILGYVEILGLVQTAQVEPTPQVTGLENVTREDRVCPCLSQEEALSASKNTQDGLFKTKAIFE